VFAFFNLTSCTHQSVIKSSSAHIDQSQSSSEKNTDNPAVINLEHTTAKNDVIPIFSNEVKEPVYSVVVYETSVKEVLFAIARDSKMNIDIHPAVQGRVTMNAVDQTLAAILGRIVSQS
jgi:general secretion pathway protein D